jgi:hypothetical protein
MDKKRAAAVLALFLAPILAAQPGSRADWGNLKKLTAGDEVRIVDADRGPMRARFQGVTDESILISTAGREEALTRAAIVSVAVRGESHRRRNALIGLGIGAGAGLAVGAAADANSCKDKSNCFNILPNIGKEVLTPLGALVGVTVGALLPTGGWHDIYHVRPPPH